MKALRYTAYGEHPVVEEIPEPVPGRARSWSGSPERR